MFNKNPHIVNFDIFSETEKEFMKQNEIEYKKEMGNFIKECRNTAKLSTCYYCGNEITSFCNSHSIPAFCLRNIATSGDVACLNALIDFPLLDDKKGVKEAGTFHLICRDCDSKIFADYENPYNYKDIPSQKMIAQIALKNNLRFISTRLLEKEMYKKMGDNNPFFQNINNAKQYVNDLDLQEYVNGFKKAKRTIEKNWTDEYYICYYEKLNYVVPIAFQDCISIATGFDGEIINDIYNMSETYKLKPIHICVFPLQSETVILMFIDNGDTRFRKFYKQFNKLSLDDRLATLTYIMFAYSENIFFSKNIMDLVKNNSALVEAGQSGQDILSNTPYFNPIELAKEKFDLSKRKNVLNLLSEEYKLNSN
jgi:hypothetical protein